MVLPILTYGDSLLRKQTENINPDYHGLEKIINDMWETMYAAHGVGLAAPQIGKSINLFIIDTSGFEESSHPVKKGVFINSSIVEEYGEEWEFEEGCLSIPHIREKVKRLPNLVLRFQDENFIGHEMEFDDIVARVIQHEFDHCEGILFIDHISQLRKRLLKNKLLNISKGGANVDYKMKLPVLR